MRRTAVAAALLLVALAQPTTAHAKAFQTFTVNSANDASDVSPGDGICLSTLTNECTLRAALEESNAKANTNVIRFSITGTGAHSIVLSSGLGRFPTIAHRVIINGYSQPGSSANTLPSATNGSNAVVDIFIDGSSLSPETAFSVSAGAARSIFKGIAIGHFGFGGIAASGKGVKVQGCFLGTDATGVIAASNLFDVLTSGPGFAVIGGPKPADRNVIASSTSSAVELSGGHSIVDGNLIGVGANLTNLANGTGASDEGVQLGSSFNTVRRNVIMYSAGQGVFVGSNVAHNRILSNSIFDNGHLGIDLYVPLEPNEVTLNDAGDTDTGANHLQNYPVLTSALASNGKITGTLDSKKDRTYTIQFFESPTIDGSGYGEGKTFLGHVKVRTNHAGHGAFSFRPSVGLTLNDLVTATATDRRTFDTSEFSAAITVQP